MKHFLGYGVLVLALVSALAWGYKNKTSQPMAYVQGGVSKPLIHGHQGTNFDVDLMPQYPNDGSTFTDHARSSLNHTDAFTWTLGVPFALKFDTTICKEGNPLEATVADSAGNYNATCTLLKKAITAGTRYNYYFTDPQSQHPLPMTGPKTCDGCFIDPTP